MFKGQCALIEQKQVRIDILSLEDAVLTMRNIWRDKIDYENITDEDRKMLDEEDDQVGIGMDKAEQIKDNITPTVDINDESILVDKNQYILDAIGKISIHDIIGEDVYEKKPFITKWVVGQKNIRFYCPPI